MEYRIRRALEEDVPGIAAVMEEAVRSMQRSEWFISDDETFIREHISEKGFTMVAEEEGEESPETPAGFLIVKFPGLSEKNLGLTLGFTGEKLLKVAHMDSAAVLPRARGNRLQARLVRAAERELLGSPYTLLMATVHPENRFSLSNMRENGYQVMASVRRYGGLPRLVLLKDLEKAQP